MAGRPDHFMPFYIADYLGDTRHLSLAQHGAYMLLIFQYWRVGCAVSRPCGLPDDDVILARICSATVADWDTVSVAVRAYFKIATVNGKKILIHKRIEQELDKARSNYAKRVAASARANKAKLDAANRLKEKFGADSVTATDTDTATVTETAADTVTDTVSVTQLRTHNSKLKEEVVKTSNGAASAPAVVETPISQSGDELPPWLPRKPWDDFCEMRVKIRHRMTDAAKALTIRDLNALREKGHDPTAVLEQSIQRGWRGVFEIGEKNGNGKRLNPTKHEQWRDGIRQFLEAGDASGADTGTSGPDNARASGPTNGAAGRGVSTEPRSCSDGVEVSGLLRGPAGPHH